MKGIANIIIIVAVLICCSCIFDGWHYEEIKRVKSPDGCVDAVFVQGNGGATTNLSHLIFLVPSGTQFDEKLDLFDEKRAVFRVRDEPDIDFVWRKAKFLEIRFEKAHISNFRNNLTLKIEDNDKYRVEIRLVPLNEETSLSSE